MADASRFPRLELPFAIVGASAGWLSAGLLANPLVLDDERRVMQPVATFCAMTLAGATGLLMRRWCVGKHCWYSLDAPDPEALAPGDVWWRHTAVLLVVGAATGAIVAGACDGIGGPLVAAGIALLCTLAFLPVCLTVLAAGRRAQRARLGSIVADSDRRAVWSILAVSLGVTTLEALPDWPASSAGKVPLPLPALSMVLLAGLAVLAVRAADLRAKRHALAAIAAIASDAASGAEDSATPRIDLGVGEELGACVARSASPYRGRDETVALVQGDPALAQAALGRAVSRGRIGLAVLGAVLSLHVGAYACLGGPAYDALQTARIHLRWRMAGIPVDAVGSANAIVSRSVPSSATPRGVRLFSQAPGLPAGPASTATLAPAAESRLAHPSPRSMRALAE